MKSILSINGNQPQIAKLYAESGMHLLHLRSEQRKSVDRMGKLSDIDLEILKLLFRREKTPLKEDETIGLTGRGITETLEGKASESAVSLNVNRMWREMGLLNKIIDPKSLKQIITLSEEGREIAKIDSNFDKERWAMYEEILKEHPEWKNVLIGFFEEVLDHAKKKSKEWEKKKKK